MASARAQVARFVVGTPGVAWASIWRVWVERDGSIYVAARTMASRFKASLHATGDWRIGFQHTATGGHRLPPGLRRTVFQFSPAREPRPGVMRAFTLVTPWFAVIPGTDGATVPRDTVWITPPDEDRKVECMLLITTPPVYASTWPGEKEGSGFISRIPLPDGRTLWIVSRIGAVTEEELAHWRAWREQSRAVVEGVGLGALQSALRRRTR